MCHALYCLRQLRAECRGHADRSLAQDAPNWRVVRRGVESWLAHTARATRSGSLRGGLRSYDGQPTRSASRDARWKVSRAQNVTRQRVATFVQVQNARRLVHLYTLVPRSSVSLTNEMNDVEVLYSNTTRTHPLRRASRLPHECSCIGLCILLLISVGGWWPCAC
eukprot:COSAG01_NODE_624_length_14732_cov_58.900772_4_plen_165_part_00